VEHFLQAENWEEAAALLDGYGETMLKRGEASTFLRWMGMIPEDVIYRWQELCLSYVWASIFAGQLETVDHLLQTPYLAASPDPAVAGSVLAARAYVARLRQDVPQTIALSRRALETMTDADPNLRAVLAVGLGLAYWQTGQVQESVTALVEAIEMGRRAENHYATLVAIGFLATARATQGQLREAIGLLEEAFRWWRDLPASSGSYHIMGALLYEQNDLKGAATHIEQGIALARRSGNVELLEGACRQMARLQQALGDTVAARGALEEATRAAGDGATPLSRSRIAAAHAQLALDHGDLEAARHWAAQREVAVDPSPFYPLLDLLPARLSLAAGDKDAAARHLQEQAARALAAGWQYGLIETRLLQALAASDVERALTFLEDALQRGAPEGFVRVFVDHGAALLSLLHAAAQRNIHAPYVRKLVAAFGSAPGPVPMPAPAEAAPATALVEPLSERELEIVALLLARRTNAEIALALSISVNTVKTHLRHIYEKLGVNDRHAAARRARELNLAPPRA
jgi:LuxR family maltose regulon positive regulatory protein